MSLDLLKYQTDSLYLIVWILYNIWIFITFGLSVLRISLKRKDVVCIVCYIIFVVLSTYSLFASDFLNYKIEFITYKASPNTFDTVSTFSQFFVFLFSVCDSCYCFRLSVFVIGYFFVFKIASLCKNKYLLFLFFANIFLFFMNANVLRAFLAYSLFFYGFISSMEKKKYFNFIFVLLSIWIHPTLAMNFLPMLLAFIPFTKIRTSVCIFVLGVCLSLSSNQIFFIIIDYMNNDNIPLYALERYIDEEYPWGDITYFVSMVKKMIMLVISLMIIVYALRKRNTCDNVNFFLVKYLYFVVIMTMCLSAIDISHYVYERFWQQNYLIITYLLVNLCAQNKKKIIKETLVFLFFCYWLLENFYILKNYMIFTL